VVNLTDAGRRLRDKGSRMNLMKASGLSAEEFSRVQRSVVALRDNLIKAAQDE
jgi:MarR family transcriptional regulator, organic hydroperoxide resistance regulator